MKYIPPFIDPGVPNPDPNASYVDANPGAGIDGSVPPAAGFEAVMREMVAAIVAADLIPDENDLTQFSQAAKILGSLLDMSFMAGIASDGSGQDLAVQEYGRLVLARNARINGFIAKCDIAPTGADIIMDVQVNGLSIYDIKPVITAGQNVSTAGTLVGAATHRDVNFGDVVVFSIAQVGSTVKGQQLSATLKASGR